MVYGGKPIFLSRWSQQSRWAWRKIISMFFCPLHCCFIFSGCDDVDCAKVVTSHNDVYNPPLPPPNFGGHWIMVWYERYVCTAEGLCVCVRVDWCVCVCGCACVFACGTTCLLEHLDSMLTHVCTVFKVLSPYKYELKWMDKLQCPKLPFIHFTPECIKTPFHLERKTPRGV